MDMTGIAQSGSDATSVPALGTSQLGAGSIGRDEFLRLLVTKLTNQDPLQPAEDTQFISQLATFSSLEQLISVNDNLKSLGGMQAEMVNAQALNLIGKQALVEAGSSVQIRNGQPDELVYAIPREAQQASISIVDGTGTVVRTIQLDPSPQGRVALDWDGLDDDGNALADGEYTMRVDAVDTDGDPMSIALFRSLPIDGVTFVNGQIALISGDKEIPFNTIVEFRAGRTA